MTSKRVVQLDGKSVLITGGTRGLGKAIGLEFGHTGARVFLTHRWGSVDEDQLVGEFRAEGLADPIIVECDASDPVANRELMALIRDRAGTLDIVINNVAFAKVVHDLNDLKKNSLDLSLAYSAWPVVDLIQAAQEVIGRLPSYVLGISSEGSTVCSEGYDLIGVSKAVMETLCRYLAMRLKPQGVRVNVVRAGYLDTESTRATFGDAMVEAAQEQFSDLFLDPRGIARCCVALCSGLMDAMTGQVLVVDEGWSLLSTIAIVTKGLIPGYHMPEEGAVS